MSSLRDRRRFTRTGRIGALVLALVAGACSTVRDAVVLDRPADRVDVKGYPLDLAFGALEELADDPPAATVLDMGFGPIAFDAVEDIVAAGPPKRPPAEPRPACPDPGPGVVAERPITGDARGAIEPGVYLFKQTGSIEIVGLTTIPVPALTNRTVRHVAADDTSSTYDVLSVAGTRRQEQRIRVVPGDGVFLVALRTTTNGDTIEFNPMSPVEIFPLPVEENTAINGAGVDPLSGQVLLVQGTVPRKDRVVGCDEVFDGWVAETTWTFQRGAASQVYDFDYTVATQHGGLVIADHLATIESYGTFTARIDVTSTAGTVHPRPETAR